jgi:hypothetical protein
MTRDEAIEHHLPGAVPEADQVLGRRRREAPTPRPNSSLRPWTSRRGGSLTTSPRHST